MDGVPALAAARGARAPRRSGTHHGAGGRGECARGGLVRALRSQQDRHPGEARTPERGSPARHRPARPRHLLAGARGRADRARGLARRDRGGARDRAGAGAHRRLRAALARPRPGPPLRHRALLPDRDVRARAHHPAGAEPGDGDRGRGGHPDPDLRAHGAHPDPGAAQCRVHHGGTGHGRGLRAHPRGAHPPERDRSAADPREHGHPLRDHHRGGPLLPRHGGAAADAELGHHPQRWLLLSVQHSLAGDRGRTAGHHHHARLHLPRREPARRVRSEAPQGRVSRSGALAIRQGGS